MVNRGNWFKNFITLSKAERNLVSSPHPVSNLRLIKFTIPEKESATEKKYREKRIKLQNFNQIYWESYNRTFYQEKEKYMSELRTRKDQSTSGPSFTQEELSNFYKKFLDDNHVNHVAYSREWYLLHFKLLFPALKAFCASSIRKLRA